MSTIAVTLQSRRLVVCLLICAGILCASSIYPRPYEPVIDEDDRQPQPAEVNVQPGVILVKLAEGVGHRVGASSTGIASLDQLGARYRVTEIKRAFPFLEVVARQESLSETARSLRRVYELHYGVDVPPREVVRAYDEDPNVAAAQPRFIRNIDPISPDQPTASSLGRPSASAPAAAPLQAVPNDSLFDEMVHLPHIHLPEAWDLVKGEDSDVVVAVVDGGTEWRHSDLRDNVWENPGEIPDNNIDDDENGFVDDVHGWNFGTDSPDPTGSPDLPKSALHGTAVAGVVGGVTNNEIGIAGSSWNATFMPIGAACEDPRRDGSICYGLEGILYAAHNGADIINASWGGLGFSEIDQDVLTTAREQGALVVASAGNAGINIDPNPSFPASAASVLTVGATQQATDQIEGFSNFGASVDVFAPGIDIHTTVPDDTFRTISGTSFSTPLVSGVAALVEAAFADLTVEQVREQVRVTSDPIEEENPGFEGRLGQGRVNASRAVTETDMPSVRVIEAAVAETEDDDIIQSGETIDLSLTFANFLADAGNVTAELTTRDTLVSITEGMASLGGLATGDTTQTTFTFEVAENTPRRRQAVFFVEINADDHTNRDVLRFVINPARAIEHTTESLRVSITNECNIGFVTFADSPGPGGVGFELHERNLLFEGGLLVGADSVRVSDCVRGDDPNQRQDDDFVPQPGSTLEITRPGEFTTEEGDIKLVDDSAAVPMNISVQQKTYVNATEEDDEFIIFRYVITNRDTTHLSNLHAGIFLDWDIGEDPSTDESRFDEDRRFGYVFDGPSPTALGGAKLLTTDASLSYRAIDNPEEIYRQTAGGFTEEEKWSFLSGGIQETRLMNTDVSQLISSGPFSLEPGVSTEVAFAIIGAETESQLLENADHAQALWDETLSEVSVDIEKPAPESPTAFSLETIYPNPTSSDATFTYQMAQAGQVRVKVYDLLGREIRTLVADRRRRGAHEVTWDGLNELGNRVSNGLYLVRLTVATDRRTFTSTRKLMLVR